MIEIIQTLETVKKTLESSKDQINREFKAKVLGIFGSYVRGDETPESDLDVLVRFREGATLFDLVGLADYLEGKLGIKVDVVSERAVRPELKQNLLEEVVAV